jgi:predicted porin
MNKKLLAIAVGAAMVAGSTAAMAEASLYGKIHVSIDSLNNGVSGTVADNTQNNSGIWFSSNSSRLGIKGKEDLGNGLNAIYKYEMATEYTFQSLAGKRNAYLGLNGGFGSIIMGRHDTPFKTLGRKVDNFGDTIGDSRNLTNDFGNDARLDNMLMYMGKFGAVGVNAQYVPEDGTKGEGALGLSVTFDQGPMGVAVAMSNMKNPDSAAPINDEDTTGTRVTGYYKFGPAKIALDWQQEAGAGGVKDADGDTLGVHASFKSGMQTYKASYVQRSNDVASGPKNDGTLIAIGADHNFSKTTKVYAVYAQMTNDDGADYGLGQPGHDKSNLPPVATGETYSGLSIGMITSF